MRLKTRIIIGAVVMFSTGVLLAPFASADIVKVQSSQSCNVVGLDPSPAASQGGVHCLAGNTPFNLTDVLNGTIQLFVGNSSTPSWNLINNTGAALTSLTLFYSGALASNAFIDMQISGTTLFQACTATTAANVVTTDANCGSNDVTSNGPALPVKLVWSGGSGVAVNGVFNLGTASFAHAGADAGCFSGSPTCTPTAVPEPTTLLFVGTALAALGVWSRKRLFGRTAV